MSGLVRCVVFGTMVEKEIGMGESGGRCSAVGDFGAKDVAIDGGRCDGLVWLGQE